MSDETDTVTAWEPPPQDALECRRCGARPHWAGAPGPRRLVHPSACGGGMVIIDDDDRRMVAGWNAAQAGPWGSLRRFLADAGATIRWDNVQRLCFSPPGSAVRFVYDGIELLTVGLHGEPSARDLGTACREAIGLIDAARARGVAVGPRPVLHLPPPPLSPGADDRDDLFAHVDD